MELDNEIQRELKEAVLFWTGYETSVVPVRNKAEFLSRFEGERGQILLKIILKLEEDFYNFVSGDISVEQKILAATREFRKRHPELDEDIVEPFAWCHAFFTR